MTLSGTLPGPGPRTSAEEPWPVRTVARKIAEWIGRLGEVWVEGQVAQVSRRPGARTAFLVLRDTAADISLSVTCPSALLGAVNIAEGARVVIRARPDFYPARGTLSLRASEIRAVGIGELLAQLERRKQLLAAEGLFAPERKRRLPFLPAAIGLITGRASAAERDVLRNATQRWPAVRFRVEAVAVQGPLAVTEILAALARLEADPDVEVIVVARGGGSVEDLLPFSDEALCRAVAAARTPVVSAIGHEPDTPLLDLVADLRASTPTDAGKRIVPALSEELAGVADARNRARRAVRRRLATETERLTAIRARPVLADPRLLVSRRAEDVEELIGRLTRCLDHRLQLASSDIEHARGRVRGLSPAATLDRGYAVVQAGCDVIRDPAQVAAGDPLRIRVARGEFAARRDSAPHRAHPGEAAQTAEENR